MMLERWIEKAMNPGRKRLVVKVTRDVPAASQRKSPEETDSLFHVLFKDTDLAVVPNAAFSANIDGLKEVFSTGTAVLSGSIDSSIRNEEYFEEEDYPIPELCGLDDGWDASLARGGEEE